MPRTITVIVLAVGVLAVGVAALAATASAQTSPGAAGATRAEPSAQSRRPPARIRVAPAYPYRLESTTYPVPYRYEYPGPGFVRQCTSWLAPENRVSGAVIVPKMRCWWQPG